jgi:hypothetical protein
MLAPDGDLNDLYVPRGTWARFGCPLMSGEKMRKPPLDCSQFTKPPLHATFHTDLPPPFPSLLFSEN